MIIRSDLLLVDTLEYMSKVGKGHKRPKTAYYTRLIKSFAMECFVFVAQLRHVSNKFGRRCNWNYNAETSKFVSSKKGLFSAQRYWKTSKLRMAFSGIPWQ